MVNYYQGSYWLETNKLCIIGKVLQNPKLKTLDKESYCSGEAIKWAKGIGTVLYDLCIVEKERLPSIYEFKTGFSKKCITVILRVIQVLHIS